MLCMGLTAVPPWGIDKLHMKTGFGLDNEHNWNYVHGAYVLNEQVMLKYIGLHASGLTWDNWMWTQLAWTLIQTTAQIHSVLKAAPCLEDEGWGRYSSLHSDPWTRGWGVLVFNARRLGGPRSLFGIAPFGRHIVCCSNCPGSSNIASYCSGYRRK